MHAHTHTTHTHTHYEDVYMYLCFLIFAAFLNSPNLSQQQHASTLQQQQMLLSLNQCYSQLLQQQHEMGDRFSRLERLVLLQSSQSQDTSHSRDPDISPWNPIQHDRLLARTSPYVASPASAQGGSASAAPRVSTEGAGRNFDLQPNFPDAFSRLSRPSPPEILTNQSLRDSSFNHNVWAPGDISTYRQSDGATASGGAEAERGQGERHARQLSYKEMYLNNRDSDNIPIDTIRATESSIPRLNLEWVVTRPKKKQNTEVDNRTRNQNSNNDGE